MPPSACPQAERLEQFARGQLPPAEHQSLAQHLNTCESCLGRASTLPGLAPLSRRPTLEGPAAAAPLERGTLVGRYVILQLLGSGAMGYVYEAFDPELERKVALKLLRTARAQAESRSRLVREAQAMARLSHPNTVPVFDVGSTPQGHLFLAMERVEGQTLTEWCQAHRDWRQLLACFRGAGRGLAAAHAAGLVHRDFKPHNVLVGEDGRARVTDFGLVRLLSETETPPTPATPADGPPADAELGAPLTREGALIGTPHYMSPEQLSGDPVDPRSDQYSFCVALYQALYGERPFAGELLHLLLAQQRLDQVQEAPRGTRVPQWVRKALLRGLRNDPAERFPSMDALLSALDRDPARRLRRAGLGLALVAGIGALVTVQLVRLRDPGACAQAGAPISEAWSPSARAALDAAYAALKEPFAPRTSEAVDAALSRYGQRWADLSRATCEAAKVRREVPEDAYVRQRDCLDQRRRELAAFVHLLARSDGATLANGIRSVQALAPPEDCARTDAPLLRRAPEWALHPTELEALRTGLARVEAQNALAHYRAAIAAADQAQAQAPHLRQTPLVSTLLRRKAFADFQLTHLTAAAEGYEQSALISERLGDDASAVDAWIDRATAAVHLAHYDEAGRFLAFAQAKLERLGDGASAARLRWLTASSNLASQRGHYAEAAAQLRTALADSRLPWTPLQESASREQLANTEKEMGNDEAAAADYTRAIELLEQERKAPTPQLAGLYGELGIIRHHQGRDPEARSLYQRAIDMDEALFGADSLDSASWLNNLAVLESDAGHLELALEILDRVLRIKERVHGPAHPSVAVSLINQSNVDIQLGHPRTAEERLRRAAEILVASKGEDHPDLVAVYTNLGAAQREQGRLDDAEASFSHAEAIAKTRLRRDHPWLSSLLSERGANDLARRRWREAKADFERALEVDAANQASPADRAASRFGLAQALMRLGQEPSRARSLAKAALSAAEAGHLPAPGPTAEEIRRWLQAHRAIAPAR